jgi:uncharacterized phage protein (TIGR01671 family)
MREILFRGKRIDNGKWVYGFYGFKPNGAGVDERFVTEVTVNTSSNSVFTYFTDVLVTHETVGQYTGLEDKNGVKIFEGDVLNFDGDKFVISWNDERCGFRMDYWMFDEQYDLSEFWPTSEIIGNIHDNQELMGE